MEKEEIKIIEILQKYNQHHIAEHMKTLDEEEKVTAVHVITFVTHEDSIPETVYNEEREELIIPSVREEDLEDGEIEFASIKIEF